ncbi:uncharacterized protein [Battus philenor]|uniref:uncharacterized protein n=1 Tax=Battus philenor TaxID=42288 RepID=UPI0035CF8D7C
MQSKSFTEVGVGSVKVLQKRKVKRIYLPATEERAVGTLDFPLCENQSNPNDKVDNSEIEISLEMSRLLNNKNQVEFSSSLDSLVQHVYNLDKPYNGTASQISIDPMENKLEREYRKIFTSQSRECPCNNKFSTTNSDSLLRRFEALRRDTLGEKESKRNSISKNSSHINKPICKDVCIDSSEQPAPYAASNSNMKTISPLPSIHKKSLLKTDKNNDLNPSKPKKSTHWRSSDVEGNEHQGLKGMFKSWGKKLSLDEGCYKKSKLKCFDSKKKSTSSVKSGKLFNIKSTDEKDERKFRFFRKKVKVGLKVSKSKKDVMTGRCEVREGLTIKIGKTLKKTPSKYEINDDMVLKTWLQRFVSKSDESTKNLTMRWDSSVYGSCSDGSEIQTKSSYETDILLYSNSTQKNDSRHKTDRNCLINFSRQYIQAWMIPKTILDRIVKTKIYWNAKSCNKYNRKKEIDFGVVKSNKYSIDKSVASPDDVTDHNSPSMREDYSSECVMVNISLGRISELRQQTYTHKTSNEEVYNVIDYETPLPSSENFLGDEKDNIVVNNKSTKESINRKDNDFKGDQLNSEKVPSVLGIRIIPQRKMRDLKYPLYDVKNYKSDDNLEGSLYLLRKNYKNAEIYLRNLCNKWIPLGLDLHLWCISDPKLQSSCSVNKKDENFHSYPNIADNIRFTTLASSRDAAINKGSEKCASRNKRSSIKTIIRKNKNEKTEIGVRIWPKDSLEVLKKRRLYSNSNKGKWHYDKELSVTVSNTAKSKIQSKSKMNKLPKKHVTISETETNKETKNKVSSVKVMGIDKCLKNNMKLPGLPTSQHASEFLKETSIVPETNPKKNGGKIISQNVSLESDDTTSSDDDENCYSSEEYSNSVFPRKEYIPNTPEYPNLKPNNDNNCSKSSNQNKTTTEKVKDVSSKSGFNFSDCLKPSAIRNKCQNLRQKFTFEKKNSIESIKNENKIKKCSITTDVQKISSLSKMFPDDKHDPEINRVKAKMLGLHFKKQPIKRNISRACWTVDDKHETNVAGDLINDLKKLASTNDFKECPKIETEDVNGDLVEVKNERKNTNTSVCLDRKESQLCTISVLSSKKKSYHDKDAKIDKHNDLNKGSDFIEISFKIKRKQIDDKALFVNINESSDRDKKEDLKKKIKKKESNATNKNNAV